MAKAEKENRGGDKGEKKGKKDKDGQKRHSSKSERKQNGAFSLLADDTTLDPTLSSLFAAKPTPPVPAPLPTRSNIDLDDAESDEDDEDNINGVTESDVEGDTHDQDEGDDDQVAALADSARQPDGSSKRKRKRKDDEDDIEDVYMRRLAREEAKDAEAAAAERAAKRQKDNAEARDPVGDGEALADQSDEDDDNTDVQVDVVPDGDDDVTTPPPLHETQLPASDAPDLSKANRTVFLGNVSTAAISSKSARKTLINHLRSFFPKIAEPKSDQPKHAIESIRFRSTPYATSIPKKAAFARKEVMDATSKSTNAYAVYSSLSLARQATKHLNGTVVLGRHLRVDEIAHPAPIDHHRCVFVGNLGFVDDESNINAANAEAGHEQRKTAKEPADVEEGLWVTFSKCGAVESVRVIRDSTTRVGKGIAYVQFEDQNAVEAALLMEGKKFPPMLPRKLRVQRAKAQKRNAKDGSGRPSAKPRVDGFQRPISSEQARQGKLFGRAAAGQLKSRPPKGDAPRRDERSTASTGLRKPEDFVFEGHRAKNSKGARAGLKLGGKSKAKMGKPTDRSARRGAEFKAGRKKKT